MLSLESIERLLTPAEVARILSVNVKTIYEWAELGIIPSLKLGGCVRFDPKQIAIWLETCRKGPLLDYNNTSKSLLVPRKGGKS